MAFSDKVKFILSLESHQMSQMDLVRSSGVLQKTINEILLGNSKSPRLHTAKAIAQSLGVSLDWLANDELPDDEIPDWGWASGDCARITSAAPADGARTTSVIPAPDDDHVEVRIAGIADRTEHFKRLIRQAEQAKRAEKKPAADPPRTGRTGTPASPSPRPKKS